VKENNLKIMNKLLKGGINPNGITSNGLSKHIPLTSVDFKSPYFYDIVRMLLKNGADINGEDLEGHTIFTKCILFFLSNKNYTNPNYFDRFTFLLERGANPDGTIFNNPLTTILVQNKIHDEDIDIIFYLCELMIAYNANPKFKSIFFNKIGPDFHLDSFSLVNNTSNKKSRSYMVYKKLFTVSVESIVKDCNSDILLDSLAKFYKIPFDGSAKDRKKLCDCVSNISKNKKEYDEDSFSEIRKKKRIIETKKECSNDSLIIGSNIDSFRKDELVYLDEKNPDLRYCFHVSEIPMLLANRKNPYNNKPLEEEFINEIVDRKYVVPRTLEESLDDVFIFTDTSVNNNVLLDKLTDYVKTFNTYIQTSNINSININDLVEIQNVLYQGNRDIIARSTLPSDRAMIPGESPAEAKSRIIGRTLTHIFIYLKNNDGSLPLVSNIIDQVIHDAQTAKEILDLFPKYRVKSIIRFMALASYNQFITDFYRYILINPEDRVWIYNDKNFLETVPVNERIVIATKSTHELTQLYRQYISSNIETILRRRFGDSPISTSWNDIVPALIR